MNTDKLLKAIQILVKEEVKQQLPALIKEGVRVEVKRILAEQLKPQPKKQNGGISIAKAILEEDVVQRKPAQQQKQFSKNPTINEILKQTKPFNSAQRASGQMGGGSSVLDSFQQINEEYQNTHIPNYMEAEPDIDETMHFGAKGAALGVDGLRVQMAAKMGYGDMGGAPKKGGLGVTTGLAGLDRILNRDNSELVKRFKK
jgi:hypothetical protein